MHHQQHTNTYVHTVNVIGNFIFNGISICNTVCMITATKLNDYGIFFLFILF